MSRTERYERLWRKVHGRMVMLAEGGTTSYDSDQTHGGKPGSKPPPPAGQELLDLERRWAGCNTDSDRRGVLNDACEYLKHHTIPNRDIRKDRGTKDWRRAIAEDPLPVRAVAYRWAVSSKTVIACRREFKIKEAG